MHIKTTYSVVLSVPQLPTGRFQLRNPKTGMCAVILKNSDAAWAKVVAHSCSCQNVYHYWKLNKKVQTQTLVSEGRSRQCLANWEALGHPGVTQCGCAEDEIHWWSFSPFEVLDDIHITITGLVNQIMILSIGWKF